MSESNLDKEYNRVRKLGGEDSYDPPIPISKILRQIEDGTWVIPEFQRDFVWGGDKFTLLFDSIYRGYTIGNLLLWDTNEKLAHRKVGEKEAITLEKAKNSKYTYILDGQQRLTSLFGVLKKKALYRSGKKKTKTYRIYFDLKKDEFISEDQKIKEFEDKTIKKLIDEGIFDRFRFIDLSQIFDEDLKFPKNIVEHERDKIDQELDDGVITKEEHKKKREEIKIKEEPLEKFKDIIKSYKIHQIVEREKDLDKVVTVFERINTQNVKLDIFDIMVAKTYENVKFKDKTYTFNLGRAISKIKYIKELEDKKFSPIEILPEDENLFYNIDPTTMLRLISIFYNSDKKIALQKDDIYKLKAQSIQDNLKGVKDLLQQIHRYFKNQINLNTIDVSYTDNKILSFLAYIFSKKDYSKINSSLVNKWFWNTLLFNRFPGAQLQRIESDLKEYNNGEEKFLQHIKKDRSIGILNENFPLNNNFYLIDSGYNNQNYLYLASILLLNSLKPKDFNGKDEINLSEYVGLSTKNNKHHIIPQNSRAAKKLREKYNNDKFVDFIINNISNICIISSELNQEIKKKDPKDYFKDYEGTKNFKEILSSHLIDEAMYEDLICERYEEFLIKRTSKILELIKERCQINEEFLEFNQIQDSDNGS